MKQWIEKEEQALACFDKTFSYELWLHNYLQFAQLRQGSRAFLHCLRRFIRRFRPEPLLPNKTLWLHLEKDGCFAVRCGKNGQRLLNLSETDKWVFRCLCFLQLRRFWVCARKRCRYPKTDLPICIPDFSDRLDESIDFPALLSRAGNQVVLI